MPRREELISERTRQFWLEASRQGTPPTPTEVAMKQYGLMAPWHIREGLWSEVVGLGRWKGKRRRARLMSRDHGKSIGVGFLALYSAEYQIPFIPKLRHENKRIIFIGRDENHLRRENFDTIETLICEYAPWLKTRDEGMWEDPVALKEYKVKDRAWTTTHKDLTNGVSIRGYGFKQGVRGAHVPLGFFDDPIDEEDAHHGEQHIDKLGGAVMGAIISGGLLMGTGTPIDDNDLWRYAAEDAEWQFSSMPAIDEEGKLGYREKNLRDIDLGYLDATTIRKPMDLNCLWPARMDYESLVALRGTSPRSELIFLREYQMQRAAAWNLLVHPDYYRRAKNHAIHYLSSVKPTPGTHTFMGVDPSTLVRSNFVIWLGCKLQDERIRVLHREKIDTMENEPAEQRLGRALQCLDRMRSLFARFNPRKIVVEGNGYQSMIQPLLTNADARLKGRIELVSLTSNKHFEDGWPLIRTVFEAGHVELPYGPTPSEQAAYERGEIQPQHFEARRITDSLWDELNRVKYLQGRILEDQQSPRDQVAAFYFLLRAAEYQPPSVGITGVPLNANGMMTTARLDAGRTRRHDPELARSLHTPPSARGRTAWDQVRRAEQYRRRW